MTTGEIKLIREVIAFLEAGNKVDPQSKRDIIAKLRRLL